MVASAARSTWHSTAAICRREVGPTALLRGSNGSVIVAGNDAAGVRTWGWIARLLRDGRWGRVDAAGWIDELDPFDAAVRLKGRP